MALEIPKEDRGSITTIQTLSSASMEKLISAIKDAPLISDPQEMAAHVSKRVPSLQPGRLSRVLDTLYTLYHIRELSGVKHARFIEDLMDGIRDSELRIAPKDLPKLQALLERLMSIDKLNTIAKAARLQRDGERLYCNSKILSDIRPVFSSDPAARPLGAVLTHTLKIGYHEGADHEEFHVVLDASDLAALSDVIRRAQAKDNSLRELLKTTGLPSLDT